MKFCTDSHRLNPAFHGWVIGTPMLTGRASKSTDECARRCLGQGCPTTKRARVLIALCLGQQEVICAKGVSHMIGKAPIVDF